MSQCGRKAADGDISKARQAKLKVRDQKQGVLRNHLEIISSLFYYDSGDALIDYNIIFRINF